MSDMHRMRAHGGITVGACIAVLSACSGPRVVTTPPPIPAPTAAPTPVATVDLTKPPALGAPPSLRPPQISTRELPNGMRIVVLEQHELPLVDVILQVRSGGESDPAGKMGTATLVAAMLTEGTTNRTSLQIADQAAYLGIQLNASSGWEQSNVSLHAPTAQLDSALALFSDVVLRPNFPSADLERVRKVRLTSLQQLRDRGYRVDYSLAGAKVARQFRLAEQSGARLAVVFGDEWPQVGVKDLETGEQRSVAHEELFAHLATFPTLSSRA